MRKAIEMTNFERIKTMSIEEMAKELLCRTVCSCCIHFPPNPRDCAFENNCTEGRIQWLNSEVHSLHNGLKGEVQKDDR